MSAAPAPVDHQAAGLGGLPTARLTADGTNHFSPSTSTPFCPLAIGLNQGDVDRKAFSGNQTLAHPAAQDGFEKWGTTWLEMSAREVEILRLLGRWEKI